MSASELNLPVQLFPHSIGYSDGKVTVVTMRTPQGASYVFQAVENDRYAVLYNEKDRILMKTASINAKDAPASLKRTFEAGTLERILELQASRQLVECTHRTIG